MRFKAKTPPFRRTTKSASFPQLQEASELFETWKPWNRFSSAKRSLSATAGTSSSQNSTSRASASSRLERARDWIGGLGSPLLLYLAAAGVGASGSSILTRWTRAICSAGAVWHSVGGRPQSGSRPRPPRLPQPAHHPGGAQHQVHERQCPRARAPVRRRGGWDDNFPRVTSSTTRACSRAKSTCTPASTGLKAASVFNEPCPTEPAAPTTAICSLSSASRPCAKLRKGRDWRASGILGRFKPRSDQGHHRSGRHPEWRLFLFDATGFTTRTMKVRKTLATRSTARTPPKPNSSTTISSVALGCLPPRARRGGH